MLRIEIRNIISYFTTSSCGDVTSLKGRQISVLDSMAGVILLTKRKFLKLIHRDSTLEGTDMGCFQADFGDHVFGNPTTAVDISGLSPRVLNCGKAKLPLVGVEGFLPSADAQTPPAAFFYASTSEVIAESGGVVEKFVSYDACDSVALRSY